MLPLSKLALISKEDLATVTIPGEEFHGHYFTRKNGEPRRFTSRKRGGRPPWTPSQLRESAIDSQVLDVDSFRPCGRGTLVNGYSFAIIAAIELAAPQKDFISLKT